jgi:hypothetical protein
MCENPQDSPDGALDGRAIDLDGTAAATLATEDFVVLWARYLRRRWLIYGDHPDAESQAAHLHQLAQWPDRLDALHQSIRYSWKKILPPKHLIASRYVNTGRILDTCRLTRDKVRRGGWVTDSITGYMVSGIDG